MNWRKKEKVKESPATSGNGFDAQKEFPPLPSITNSSKQRHSIIKSTADRSFDLFQTPDAYQLPDADTMLPLSRHMRKRSTTNPNSFNQTPTKVAPTGTNPSITGAGHIGSGFGRQPQGFTDKQKVNLTNSVSQSSQRTKDQPAFPDSELPPPISGASDFGNFSYGWTDHAVRSKQRRPSTILKLCKYCRSPCTNWAKCRQEHKYREEERLKAQILSTNSILTETKDENIEDSEGDTSIKQNIVEISKLQLNSSDTPQPSSPEPLLDAHVDPGTRRTYLGRYASVLDKNFNTPKDARRRGWAPPD